MAFKCPEYKKPFVAIRASVCLKSKCYYCKSSLIPKNSTTSQTQLLLIIASATFLRHLLERFMHEYLALILVITSAIVCAIAITDVRKDDSINSN